MSSVHWLSKIVWLAAAVTVGSIGSLLAAQPSSQAGLNVPRECWLAIRTDGQPGSGTQADPFDGGGVDKLNSLLAKFCSEYGDNLTLHFGPGVFYGDRTWAPRNNWKIRGAGMDVTVFKTQSNSERIETIGFRSEAVGFEISDVTFDFNVLNLRKANRVFVFPVGKENGVEKYKSCYFHAEDLPTWKAASYKRCQAVTHKGVEFMCVTTDQGCTEEPGTGARWSVLRRDQPEHLPAWKKGTAYKAGEAVAAGGTGYICLAAGTTADPAQKGQDWQAVDPQRIDPLIYTSAAFVGPYIVNGMTGHVSRNRVSRVRALNCHGSAFFDREDFVICLCGNDNVIEDCTVEQFHGDYSTLIALCDGRHSVVRGCTVKGNGKCMAYGGWCCFDAVFENNYCENADAATNIDSLYNRNVTFRNNVCVACQNVGILVNVGGGHGTSAPMWINIDGKKIDFVNQNGMDGLYIYNNYVEMRDGAPFGAIQAQQRGLSNVVIRGNTLRTTSGHGRARAIGVLEVTHAIVSDNVCEPNMSCEIITRASPLAPFVAQASSWRHNVDLLGQPMKDIKGNPIGEKPAN